MWTDNKKAISEVNKILKQLDNTSLNKIPKILLDEIEKNATFDVGYINTNIPLENLNLEEETKEILAVITYNYFCDDAEKKQWNKELKENELDYQNELKSKYNPDNLFKNEKKENNTKQNTDAKETSLVEYKESFFRKIFNIIKHFFKKTK